MQIWNYRREQLEEFPTNATDEEAVSFISQDPVTQQTYFQERQRGVPPLTALARAQAATNTERRHWGR